jgi:hypothetical protein
MLDLLRDPIWQFIGAAIGLLALGATLALHWMGRHRKELSYEVLYRDRLAGAKNNLAGNVEIRYRGVPVPEVHFIAIRLVNSGNAPILPQDFVRPVTFTFGDSAKVLSVEVTNQTPGSLGATVAVDDLGRMVVAPTLLNAGWAMTFHVLASAGRVEVDGQVVGVSRIVNQGLQRTKAGRVVSMVAALTLLVGTVGLLVSAWIGETLLASLVTPLVVGVLSVCTVVLAILYHRGYQY